MPPGLLKRIKSKTKFFKKKDSFKKAMLKKAKNLIKGNLKEDAVSIDSNKHQSTIWKDDDGTKVILSFKDADNLESSPGAWAKGLAADFNENNINKDNFLHTLVIEGDSNDAFRKLATDQVNKLNEVVSGKVKKVKLTLKSETKSGSKILLTFANEAPALQQVMIPSGIKKNDGEIDAQARVRNLKEKWDNGTIDKSNISGEDKESIELFLEMVDEDSKQWADSNNSPAAKDLLELNKFYDLIEKGDGANFSKLLDGEEPISKSEDFLKVHQEKLKSVEQIMQDQSAILGSIAYAKKLSGEATTKQIKTKMTQGVEAVAMAVAPPVVGQVVKVGKLINRVRLNRQHIKRLQYIKGEAERLKASSQVIEVLDDIINRKKRRNYQAVAAATPVVSTLNTGRSIAKGALYKAIGKVSDRVINAKFLIDNTRSHQGEPSAKISKQIILELVGKDVYPQILMTSKGNELLSDKMRTTV